MQNLILLAEFVTAALQSVDAAHYGDSEDNEKARGEPGNEGVVTNPVLEEDQCIIDDRGGESLVGGGGWVGGERHAGWSVRWYCEIEIWCLDGV